MIHKIINKNSKYMREIRFAFKGKYKMIRTRSSLSGAE